VAILRHEVWREGEGGEMTLCLAGPRGAGARALLQRGSQLVWTVDASSHFEAMTRYYAHMGWGPYTTDFPADHKPYPEEWALTQAEAQNPQEG